MNDARAVRSAVGQDLDGHSEDELVVLDEDFVSKRERRELEELAGGAVEGGCGGGDLDGVVEVRSRMPRP
ncbi:hypothetical protein WGT02_04070 [Rhizobium sp. T1470]|nr:hypothetical protein [Rhizobium sp. T1473]MCA0800495.1 hypothetical protein [Rhizobium sp. T1473]